MATQPPGNSRKICFRVLFLALVFSTSASAQSVTVAVPDTFAPPGSAFVLPLRVSEVTGLGVFSFDLTLTYDPGLLTAEEASTSGTVTSPWGSPTFNITPGQIRVGLGGTTALEGHGELIRIRFSVAAGAGYGSSTPLTLTNFVFNEGQPQAAITNGNFTVRQDTKPPVITSGPMAGSLTSRSAVIQWTTDERSDSRVEYGLTTGYGSSIKDDSKVASHAVTLSALKASTAYHYRVGSTDVYGNGPTFSDDRTFVTADITVSIPPRSGDAGTTFAWPIVTSDLTDQEITAVRFALRFDPQMLTATGVSAEATLSATWPTPSFSLSSGQIEVTMGGSVPLSGAGTLVKITFSVASGARIGATSRVEFSSFQFNRGSPPAVTGGGTFTVTDTRAPTITAGPTVSSITATSAQIQWQSDEKSTSIVEYGPNGPGGPTPSYGFLVEDAQLVTEHSLTLAALNPSTMYHYRVGSVDSSGNGPTYSADQTFRTSVGQGILVSVPDSSVRAGSTLTLPISVTDLSGKGVFSFVASMSYDSRLLTVVDVNTAGSLASSWAPPRWFALDGQIGLEAQGSSPLSGAGLLFNIVLQVADPVVGEATSALGFSRFEFNYGSPQAVTRAGLLTLLGGLDTAPPVLVDGPYADALTHTSARIRWSTDEASTGIVNYGPSIDYGFTLRDEALSREHAVTIQNLNPLTMYHYRVGSVDAHGNGPTYSADQTFTTLAGSYVTVTMPDPAAGPGRRFQLPIEVSDLTDKGVFSCDFTLNYDPRILRAISATTEGALAGAWGPPVFTLFEGKIVVAMGGINALSGSGVLVKIDFEVLPGAMAGQISSLVFSRFIFNEGNPPASTLNGRFTVQDVSPPVLTAGPAVLAAGTRWVTLGWATDEPATSAVDFGPSSAYGASRRDNTMTATHSVTLAGLMAGTSYHYRVGSFDSRGNGPTYSSDQTFVTRAEPLISVSFRDTVAGQGQRLRVPLLISDVTGLGVFSLRFTVVFDPILLRVIGVSTENSLTRFWGEPSVTIFSDRVEVMVSGSTALEGRGAVVRFEFQTSDSAAVGSFSVLELWNLVLNEGYPVATSGAARIVIVDRRPPVIVAGPVASAITGTGASISWRTDEPSNSIIEYGLTTAYGLTKMDQTPVTNHQLGLANLQPGTTYHYRVGSIDAQGNGPTFSADHSFTTLDIGAVSVSLPDTSGAPGDTVWLPVRVSDLTGKGIVSLNFSASYDPTIVSAVGASWQNSLLSSWGPPSVSFGDGRVSVGASGSSPLTGGGVLLRLGFAIAQGAKGGERSPLTFTEFTFNQGVPPVATQPGSIRVRDVTPPVITAGPFVSSVTADSASIRWQTDEPATSIVEYGLTTGYGFSARRDEKVTSHLVALAGLTPATTYHYRVGSVDNAGNGPTYSGDGTFTTIDTSAVVVRLPDTSGAPGDTLLLPVRVSELTGKNILSLRLGVQFDAGIVSALGAESQGTVTAPWGAANFTSGPGTLSVAMSGSTALAGAGELLRLRFTILPTLKGGEVSPLTFTELVFNDGRPPVSLQNGLVRVRDVKPPVIIAGPTVASVAATSVTISWRTDEAATSLVEYGLTTSYGFTERNEEKVTLHTVTLSGLKPGTTYHFRVGSSDAEGNGPTYSGDGIFTTASAGEILLTMPDTVASPGETLWLPIQVSEVSGQNILSWSLTLAYEPTVLAFRTASSTNSLTAAWGEPHWTVIDGQVVIQMSGGEALQGSGALVNVAFDVSPTARIGGQTRLEFLNVLFNQGTPHAIATGATVRILDRTAPKILSGPTVENLAPRSATIVWQSDEPSTSILEYGATPSYGSVMRDEALVVSHRLLLTDLMPGTGYHYRVGSVDSSGNGPTYSADASFTTPPEQITVTLRDTASPPGSEFLLPLLVTETTGRGIRWLSLTLTYDPKLLFATGLSQNATLTSGWTIGRFNVTEGQVDITLQGTGPLVGAGVLASVVFRVPFEAPVGATTAMTVIDFQTSNPALEVVLVNGRFTVSEGPPAARVRLILPPLSVYPASHFEIPIGVSNPSRREIFSARLTVAFDPLVVQPRSVTQDSTLVARWANPTVSFAPGRVQIETHGPAVDSSAGLLLRVLAEVAPAAVEGDSSGLEFAEAQLNGGTLPVELSPGVLRVVVSPLAISGRVLNAVTSRPIMAAEVTAVESTTGTVRTTFTDSLGRFRFERLDTTKTYSLSASKEGYSLVNPPVQVWPGSAGLVLHLIPKDGQIRGSVTETNGRPVGGALVVADDQAGSSGVASSDSLGRFAITGLARLRSYTVTVSKFGFHSTVLDRVGVDTTLAVVLRRNFATLTGRVTLTSGDAVQGALVRVSDVSLNAVVDSTLTQADGRYRIDELLAGEFIVSAFKAGHLSEPPQMRLSLQPGQEATADFVLERATVVSIEISGPTFVSNAESHTYFVTAKTDKGKPMPLSSPIWKITPDIAGEITGGRLRPNGNFIGSALLTVRDPAGGVEGHLDIQLYAPVGPSTSILLHDETGLEMEIRSGSLHSEQKITVERPTLPEIKRNTREFVLMDQAYEIKPEEVKLDQPARLRLPIREGTVPSEPLVGRWDQATARWESLAGARFAGNDPKKKVEVDIPALGLYALLSHARPLGIRRVRFRPNPFSPEMDTDGDGHSGLAIEFELSSNDARKPFVTAKIYNMLGDLVRELATKVPKERGQNVLYWDGRTDDRRLARNGRYVVHLLVEDSTGREEYVHTVVLIR